MAFPETIKDDSALQAAGELEPQYPAEGTSAEELQKNGDKKMAEARATIADALISATEAVEYYRQSIDLTKVEREEELVKMAESIKTILGKNLFLLRKLTAELLDTINSHRDAGRITPDFANILFSASRNGLDDEDRRSAKAPNPESSEFFEKLWSDVKHYREIVTLCEEVLAEASQVTPKIQNIEYYDFFLKNQLSKFPESGPIEVETVSVPPSTPFVTDDGAR